MRDACCGIVATEVQVAAEGEAFAGFVGFASCLSKDGGGETAIEDCVEVFRDGVKGDEVFQGQSCGEMEA